MDTSNSEIKADGWKASPKRQQRGERRIDSLLRAAEAVFAEIGYERATTNLIAQRASASPGTLYQFFRDKQTMAEELAKRYAAQLSEICDQALGAERAHEPLQTITDHIVESFFSFHLKAPAFHNLLLASAISPELRKRLHDFLEIAAVRLTRLFEARVPDVPRTGLALMSRVCVSIWQSVVPLSLQTENEEQRERVVQELKAVLIRYLEPVLGV